jgi:hypothetical protein
MVVSRLNFKAAWRIATPGSILYRASVNLDFGGAIAVPSLRIFPLLFILIAITLILHAPTFFALLIFFGKFSGDVAYIQSIVCGIEAAVGFFLCEGPSEIYIIRRPRQQIIDLLVGLSAGPLGPA